MAFYPGWPWRLPEYYVLRANVKVEEIICKFYCIGFVRACLCVLVLEAEYANYASAIIRTDLIIIVCTLPELEKWPVWQHHSITRLFQKYCKSNSKAFRQIFYVCSLRRTGIPSLSFGWEEHKVKALNIYDHPLFAMRWQSLTTLTLQIWREC